VISGYCAANPAVGVAVETPLGTKLCRPSEGVLEILPVGKLAPFTKADGEVVQDNGVRRK
jgi:arsenate reductase